jgi:xanthine dehydrogenase accessory factor
VSDPASAPRPDRPGPTRDADVWNALERWRAERRRFVMATVTASRGFTPRKPGAHMLIGEAGASVGTIGGGAIEQAVRDEAAALLLRGGTAEVSRHLTQELGMCCGGEMTVFLEVVEPAPRLWLFGAGYIAKPLAAIAAGCGFEVTVVDARADWATPERFPTSELRVQAPEDALANLPIEEPDYAVVVTHDHALDQRLVQGLLPRRLHFTGMIGSIPKQRKFALRLRARGFSDADIARLRTPLGLAIGAQTPEEIAVSVMAEIIAARRGADAPAGWTPPLPRVAREADPGEFASGPDDSASETRADSDLDSASAPDVSSTPTEGSTR